MHRIWCGLVGFGPDDALGAGFVGEGAGAGLVGAADELVDGAGFGNAADGDGEVVLDGLGGLDVAVPVGEGEAAAFAFEEFVELFFVVDDLGVFLAEGFGAVEEGLLNVVEGGDDGFEEGFALDAGFVFGALVAAGHEDAVVGHVAWADFEADGDALFNPAPCFFAAAKVAGVEFDAQGFAVV